jgi:hypothetical protein
VSKGKTKKDGEDCPLVIVIITLRTLEKHERDKTLIPLLAETELVRLLGLPSLEYLNMVLTRLRPVLESYFFFSSKES